jgi:hypothetical protein
VVVAALEVEFRAVKFWRVDDEFALKLEKVPRPEEVICPPIAVEKKRLVEEAVVLKKLVEVAEVEVEFEAVKFCKVVEARVWRAPEESILMSSSPVESVKERNLPAKDGVEEALKMIPVVPVALTWKSAERSRDAVVVAPITKDLYGEEVAERKSPPATSSRVLPNDAPVSSTSQPNFPAPS